MAPSNKNPPKNSLKNPSILNVNHSFNLSTDTLSLLKNLLLLR
jgi:hypothetical protein